MLQELSIILTEKKTTSLSLQRSIFFPHILTYEFCDSNLNSSPESPVAQKHFYLIVLCIKH